MQPLPQMFERIGAFITMAFPHVFSLSHIYFKAKYRIVNKPTAIRI